MGTPFTDIFDLAMITINDYRLNNLAQSDPASFYTVLQGFMVRACADAQGTLVDLSYDTVSKTFNNDIPFYVQNIIANFLVYYWFNSLVNDITQVNLHLQGRDKKTFSSAQNLKEKAVYVSNLYQRSHQMITDYQNQNLTNIFTGLNG